MKGEVTDASDVLGLLMDPAVQKEIKRVRPKFNTTDLVYEILDVWPGGLKGFAKSVYEVFEADRPGGSGKQAIIRAVTDIIIKESATATTRPVKDMTEAELVAVIKSAAPALARLKEVSDA